MLKIEFKDLGYDFTIESVDKVPKDLKNEFKEDLSLFDEEIIDYYFALKNNITLNYLINIEDNHIGYCSLFEDETYWNLYEIYIKEEFRELGIGTKLFQVIKEDSKKMNKQIRTYTLPSDRRAKNFYESNRITARILIMEDKRAGSRYKL